ncbi:MAG: CoA pyrophosphatase, partial [Alphaproteobacteria bacterium]|nr:CoA pyrophosphatase [Alphaproteobacteria bacterium]
PDALAPAAVLIAVTDSPEPGVILTRRPDHMRAHAGQIAFPGGKVDAGDASLTAAALREAQEEIALDPAQVRVIGTTDAYRTGSGFCITPVLGIIPPDLDLHPHAGEVADIFQVPLAFLLDPGNHQRLSGEWQGHQRTYYAIEWQNRIIWGATAGMLVNLAARLA